jgi:2-polyprenyl-3-methyl-5-hydroxy-6-metoxy-1,4-benzoquinol methylase
VEDYLGMSMFEMQKIAERYNAGDIEKHKGDLKAYYASRGKEQLARQALFHTAPHCREEMEFIFSAVNTKAEGYGCEYGCGSAPVSFELALRGHRMDFVDIDGAGAYEFTKWRAKKRALEERCGWALAGPYDYVLMLDSIEHMPQWQEVLEKVVASLKPDGALITNFFRNQDYDNPEHVNMDKPAVRAFLTERGVYPLNEMIWLKRDFSFMDRKQVA